MGGRVVILVGDSDDDRPPYFDAIEAYWREPERRKEMGELSTKKEKRAHHAAAGSRKRHHDACGSRKAGSWKRQNALADFSSTAESEDLEDVSTAGSRN